MFAQFVRFGLTTASSAAISLGLPIVLHEIFAVGPKIAVAIGLLIAFFANAILIPRFVFRSQIDWAPQTLIYVGTSLLFRFVEYLAFLALYSFFDLDYRVSVLTVLSVSAITKFFTYRAIYAPRAN